MAEARLSHDAYLLRAAPPASFTQSLYQRDQNSLSVLGAATGNLISPSTTIEQTADQSVYRFKNAHLL
jgi:hypothetical protein